MNEPNQLTAEQLERFLQGARQLSTLEQAVVEAQRALVEAARQFEASDVTRPEPEPDCSRLRVAVRDADGNFLVSTWAGDVLYGSEASMTYACPADIWILDGNEVIRKQTVLEPDRWWPLPTNSITKEQ